VLVDAREFARRFPDVGTYLDAREIEALVARLPQVQVAAGDGVLREGTPSESVYLVWDGGLVITLDVHGKATEVGHCKRGSVVGEIAFLDGGAASATVTAVETSTLLRLDRALLETLRVSDPRIATSLLRALCRSLAARIRHASDVLDGLRGHVSKGHVARPSGAFHALLALFGMAREGEG
jgi:CRP-like cAMP-binding protein